MKILSILITLILALQLVGCSNTKEKSETVQTDPYSLHPSAYQTDFVGYASDSSWKVSVIFDDLILLTKKDGSLSFRGTEVKKTVAVGANVVRLTAEVESEMVEVVIDPSKCREGSNIVDVIHSKAGARTLEDSGCGYYQGDVKLYDLWTLTHLNQEKVDRSLFTKQPPFLEINLKESTVSGFGGCNDFNGKMSFDYKTFTVDALMSTKKYCGDNSKIENELFKILRGKKIHYTFKENTVIFETNEGRSITFQKID